MSPVDKTPNVDTGNFELLYSLKAYEKIPVSEYISKKTGLTVVIAEVDGPVVNGYFCLVTEAFDDDGLPHTLEHLIFLGSEEYPYKGVLDLLANRCLASGTNAWTDVDHTCYTMETAGSEGFLALMPIYLEHILYPILKDEAYITEVHHITGTGEDAGVVYCEMQGRENSAESRLHLAVARNIYPGKCGYSSETGGIMKNLRDSTNNEKVRNYHKEFYRPENLKIIITGQVKTEDVFKALKPLEDKILEKGPRSSFQRPWQTPVPYLTEDSKELVIKYPADEESNGPFAVAWRGPSCVKDLYTVTACSLLLKYLTEYSVSPLPKEFVEIEDPYASKVSYNLYENAETCLYITFEDVPLEKLSKVLPKLQEVLKGILDKEEIDMKKLESIIKRYKLESLSNIENSPHHAVAFMIIGHMLYGNTKADLEERVNPLQDLNKLLKEPKSFWLNVLKTYLVENKYVAIQCVPSKEEQSKMAKEEKERIEAQINTLGESGLKEKEELLQKALEHNDQEPPLEMLTSVKVPTVDSIKFHNIVRYKSDSAQKNEIDLTESPVFTYFDNLKTNFVYMFALLDTGKVPSELRAYLPLLLESLLELPLEKDGKLIPYEQVVAQLNDDTVSTATSLGLSIYGNRLFTCGNFSQTVTVSLQVESAKYETGLNWLKDLLYNTKFTAERLKVVAMKMSNALAQSKRSGRNVVSYVMKSMCYTQDSNVYCNGMLVQSKFLTDTIEQLDGENSQQILERFEKVRKIITEPSNYVLYIAGNLDILKNPENSVKNILPSNVEKVPKPEPLKSTPDYKLMKQPGESHINNCLIGMGCLESSFFLQTVKSISSHDDPDLPALMLYMQYLIQTEGPMWKSIRGKGYAYNYSMWVKVSEGQLYLVFGRATNVVGAYKETKEIVQKQLETKEWDDTLLEAAKSSLIFTIIDEEKTIGSVVALSVTSYFQGIDYCYNRVDDFLEERNPPRKKNGHIKHYLENVDNLYSNPNFKTHFRALLGAVNKVTKEDLNRVGELYIAPLFDPKKVKTAVVTDPSKANDIAEGFKKLNLDLTVYPSLEESFLNAK